MDLISLIGPMIIKASAINKKQDTTMCNEEGVLSRTRLLLGDTVMERIRSARVAVFGVGGVGSWCVEGLVRSGVRHVTIVDFDRVSTSNINRQLMATAHTVGRVKVEAMKEHLLEINPSAEITAVNGRFCAGTADTFRLEDYDYIIDAIDSIDDKMLLITKACDTRAVLFSSMGAARKLDPARIQVAEFRKVRGCPLARTLRNRFRKAGIMPSRKFMCVFSEELLDNAGCSGEPRANGSLLHITGIFGFTLAGLVIGDIAGSDG